MEVIKRIVSLENSTDRSENSPNWGVMVASNFYIDVLITQNIDDMGLFTDIEYFPAEENVTNTPNYTILSDKLYLSGITFPFMTGGTPSAMTGITGTTEFTLRLPTETEINYYSYGNLHVTGSTDSKIEDLRSYNGSMPFQPGFDMEQNNYIDYLSTPISGHSRVVMSGEPTSYVFDAIYDLNIGTPLQSTGLLYYDYTGLTRNVIINGVSVNIPVTNFDFVGQGWNQTNISLSALTKEEYLFGIISPPEVQSDVFIDRGITTVMDRHLKMSEITNLEQLVRYGNGFYKLRKE
jgi:hypothetical protein